MIFPFLYYIFFAVPPVLFLIPFISVRWKGILTIAAVLINAGLSAIPSVYALGGETLELFFTGTRVTGQIAIKLDALSAWFILLINFTFTTGAFYGLQYMKFYREQKHEIALHCICFILAQSMLTMICLVQNFIAFLFCWEIMAISVALLVIFEHHKFETIKSGLNYLIQSHLCIVFLSLGFIWVSARTGSFDFSAISQFSSSQTKLSGMVLFVCFFLGFAFKAGFVPFHTWLPLAHPAAPSHISGIMSGVIIKIGIYGILRMILLIKTDYSSLGFMLLFVSVFSGLYGVMLAIIQHNLKKLLAYHSIENIGIIGIGIGLGLIGIGKNSIMLSTLGFGGALLHVLNHSLFKSLLFFSAGNVYQQTHTLNVERLGGLIRKIPHSAFLFLIAALAICGLPPLNGFVSEFFLYSGLFNSLRNENFLPLLGLLFAIGGLVMIGGLAMLCFTKAFGSVFLGNSRFQKEESELPGSRMGRLFPMYAVMVMIACIGLFPGFFFQLLSEPVKLFTDKIIGGSSGPVSLERTADSIRSIGLCAVGFLSLSGLIFFIRKNISQNAVYGPTWSCGYTGDNSKMQYSASSFVRTFRKLAEPLFSIHKEKKEIKNIFPEESYHEIHPEDKIEKWLINIPIKHLKFFLSKFRFLQNGYTQSYVLYGAVFIVLVIVFPIAYTTIKLFIDFLNQL